MLVSSGKTVQEFWCSDSEIEWRVFSVSPQTEKLLSVEADLFQDNASTLSISIFLAVGFANNVRARRCYGKSWKTKAEMESLLVDLLFYHV